MTTTLREEFEALMPEPVVRCGEYAGPAGEGAYEDYYTADQVREAMKAVAERCAVLCDEHATTLTNAGIRGRETAEECAAAIRGGM